MIRITRTWNVWLLGACLGPNLVLAQEPEAKKTEPGGLTSTIKGVVEIVNKKVERTDGPEGRKYTVRSYSTTRSPGRPSPFVNSLDPLESSFGLSMAPMDDALRSQLDLNSGQGVVIVEVKPGSLGEQAGLKRNDVVLSLGADPLQGIDQARKILLGLGKETIEVKLIREGKPSRMSLVGPVHGFPPESSEYWIGVPVSPVDPTLRSHLTDLPANAGLVVNDVVKDSPADKSGVKKNDILISMGGKPLTSSESLIGQVQAAGGKPVPVVLLRAGKPLTVDVTPTRRAHPTVISLNGRINGQGSQQFRAVWPNFAIEFDPFTGKPTGAFPTTEFLNVHPEIPVSQRNGRAEAPTRWDAIVVNPNRVNGAPMGDPSLTANTKELQLELFTNRSSVETNEFSARIEARLTELSAKLDEVRKAVEELKKTGEK